jgi:hypothetical protein
MNKEVSPVDLVTVTISKQGEEDVVYNSDATGFQTAQDIADKVIEIVGERPMRKRTRV